MSIKLEAPVRPYRRQRLLRRPLYPASPRPNAWL